MDKILITGTAGFIGFHLVLRLLKRGYEVVGIDNINDYYDVNLKYARLHESGIKRDDIQYGLRVTSSGSAGADLQSVPSAGADLQSVPSAGADLQSVPNVSMGNAGYRFYKANLEDRETIDKIFATEKPSRVVNLAAQAGVRYSIENPLAYINSNIVGFANILEACRHNNIKHLVYASSSSVYGLNEKMPFSASDNVDHPISLYAASKKSNELMAHTYSHLFGLATTGLRFFTVYGPWGRPDMALFIFTKAILEGRPIQLNNNGDMQRDFTYIDDIVNAVEKVIEKIPEPNLEWSGLTPDPSSSPAPYRIYNIGNNSPVRLMDFVAAIEDELGIKAKKEFLPMQPGDVAATWADVESLIETIDFIPGTTLNSGIKMFVNWFKKYMKQSVL